MLRQKSELGTLENGNGSSKWKTTATERQYMAQQDRHPKGLNSHLQTILLSASIPPTITFLSLAVTWAITWAMGWQNRNLPLHIHLPPARIIRLAFANEPVSLILAYALLCFIALCICCLISSVLSFTASSTKTKRMATGIAAGSLGTIIIAYWMAAV